MRQATALSFNSDPSDMKLPRMLQTLLWMLALLLASRSQTIAQTSERVSFFPRSRIFAARIADPTEVQLSARMRSPRQEFNGNIGYSVGLIQFHLKHLPVQLRVEGNTFIVLKLQTPDFPVQSTDYTIAFPIDLRAGATSLRLLWMHISSHLGDDFNRIEDVGGSIALFRNERLPFSRPKKFSRGILQLFASRDFRRTRFYTGINWAYHMVVNRQDSSEVRRWGVQAGFEWRSGNPQPISPYLALDAKSRQELGWSPDFNLQVGVEIGQSRSRSMRLALEALAGHSTQGQFLARRQKDLSFVIAFDF